MALPSILAAAFLLALVPQNSTERPMSDRERASLHGPVRLCVENYDGPEIDGKQWKHSSTTEYDPDGRLLAQRFTNPDGSQSETTYSRDSQGRLMSTVSTSARGNSQTQYTYDDAGRLLKVETSGSGAASTETRYSYDTSGRMIAETATGEWARQSRYSYDEHGRKTKTLRVPPRQDNRAIDTAGSLIESAEHGSFAPPDGGVVTVLFDDHDRPTEAQIRNSQGELFSTVVRTYDSAGHVLDERQVMDNPQLMFPAEDRARILAESGGTAEELKAELKRIFGGGGDSAAETANKYDAQGHLLESRMRMWGIEQIKTFNEHGDQIGEVSTDRDANATEAGAISPAAASDRSETHIEYRYDSHGNWTEKTTSWRSADGTTKPGDVTRRTITYYSN